MSDTYEFDDDPTTDPASPIATEQQAAADTADGGDRPLYFPNAEQWVQNWLLPHYRRKLAGGRRWDPQWWRYEEAGTILEALWESWEQMRWEDAMTAVAWYRDYFWPVMDRLTAEDGPFWDYDPPRNADVPQQWDATPAPPGWF
jgi:hypothetical protein